MDHAYYSPLGDSGNEFRTSPSFLEFGFKLGYTIAIESLDSAVEFFGGVKNLTNKYQKDFDNFASRDSNYIYGPAQHRTIYFGIKLKSL